MLATLLDALCTRARYFYRPDKPVPGCHVVVVHGRRVAVAHRPTGQQTGYRPQVDESAVYRAPDGTVVRVGQAAAYDGHGDPLATPIFSDSALAALAANPRLTG